MMILINFCLLIIGYSLRCRKFVSLVLVGHGINWDLLNDSKMLIVMIAIENLCIFFYLIIII